MYIYSEIESPAPARLAHVPLAFFAMVMGLAGLAITWLKAATVLDFTPLPGYVLTAVATLVYAGLLVLYGCKLLRHPDAVREELEHPIKLNFLATISISFLLLTVCFNMIIPMIAPVTFWLATFLHLLITLYILNCWIHRTGIEVAHLNPAWFIPIVGNVVVPVAMPAGHSYDLGVFFFSVGLLFWLPLLAVVLNRLFFHNPIPQRLMPTLAILIAPPSVAFLAYFKLTGEVDFFARMLLASGWFFTLLLFTQLPRLFKIPFALSWWAYSFPLTAITTATLAYAHITGLGYAYALAQFLLPVTTGIIIILLAKTLRAVQLKEICKPE